MPENSKLGVYGPRVIGEAAFNRERAIKKTKSNIYGPRVIGKDAAAKAEAILRGEEGGDLSDLPGPEGSIELPNRPEGQKEPEDRSTPVVTEGGHAQTSAEEKEPDPTYTLSELKKHLETDEGKADYDALIAEEQSRKAPRKGALTLLLAAEEAREGGPRPEFKASIEASLAALE